jgi:hypothetical protein
LKQGIVVGVKEVEAGIRTGDWPLPATRARPAGYRSFLHGGPLGLLGAVTMFYLAAVPEKGEIVDRGLDP